MATITTCAECEKPIAEGTALVECENCGDMIGECCIVRAEDFDGLPVALCAECDAELDEDDDEGDDDGDDLEDDDGEGDLEEDEEEDDLEIDAEDDEDDTQP